MSARAPSPSPSSRGDSSAIERAWAVLDRVMDPEVPVLSVVDLGIVRTLEASESCVRVAVAPTYTGCPAVEVIEQSIARALKAADWPEVHLERSLAPPWTTDWISARGRARLQAYGIAPPPRLVGGTGGAVLCPHCGSERTERLSQFGATPCKALHRCRQCLEPFEHFKCL